MKYLVFVFLATPAFASPQYKCGNAQVTINKSADRYTIRLSSPHAETIASDSSTLGNAQLNFSSMGQNGDDIAKLTKLPVGSVGFMGFHYANGDMLIAAEADFGSEGYMFTAEVGILSGAKSVKAADYFWSDYKGPKINRYTCTRTN